MIVYPSKLTFSKKHLWKYNSYCLNINWIYYRKEMKFYNPMYKIIAQMFLINCKYIDFMCIDNYFLKMLSITIIQTFEVSFSISLILAVLFSTSERLVWKSSAMNWLNNSHLWQIWHLGIPLTLKLWHTVRMDGKGKKIEI